MLARQPLDDGEHFRPGHLPAGGMPGGTPGSMPLFGELGA